MDELFCVALITTKVLWHFDYIYIYCSKYLLVCVMIYCSQVKFMICINRSMRTMRVTSIFFKLLWLKENFCKIKFHLSFLLFFDCIFSLLKFVSYGLHYERFKYTFDFLSFLNPSHLAPRQVYCCYFHAQNASDVQSQLSIYGDFRRWMIFVLPLFSSPHFLPSPPRSAIPILNTARS